MPIKNKDHVQLGWKNDFKGLLNWLILVPVILIILFACGQLGLLWNLHVAQADSDSLLIADYGPWEYTLVHSIKLAIVAEIMRDQANYTGALVEVSNPEIVTDHILGRAK